MQIKKKILKHLQTVVSSSTKMFLGRTHLPRCDRGSEVRRAERQRPVQPWLFVCLVRNAAVRAWGVCAGSLTGTGPPGKLYETERSGGAARGGK